jgi:hypothetical protein
MLATSSLPEAAEAAVAPLGPLCARVVKKSFEPRSTLSPNDAYGEGVGGSPSRLMLVEVATVTIGGAPNSSEGGRDAVCRFSFGGDGENGRSERGMEGGVSGAAAAAAAAVGVAVEPPAVLGSSMDGKGIIGMGRDQCKWSMLARRTKEGKMQAMPTRGEVFGLVLSGSRCYGARHALRVLC